MADVDHIKQTLCEMITDDMLTRLSQRNEFDAQCLEAVRRAILSGDLKVASKVITAITPKVGNPI